MRFEPFLVAAVLVSTTTAAAAVVVEDDFKSSVAKRILKSRDTLVSKRSEAFLSKELQVSQVKDHHDSFHQNIRRLVQDTDKKAQVCDSAFMACMGVDHCVSCYTELNTKEIDWASVTPDTECVDVMSVLYADKHCQQLKFDKSAEEIFCSTFKTCIAIPDKKKPDGEETDDIVIDCSNITECDWPGFHPSFLGDGVCHEHLDGCYNTEICDWDGGDCCKDTCEARGKYLECGHAGWNCRDPKSKNCDSKMTTKCDENIVISDDDEVEPVEVDCGRESALYALVMYDSFGDGWEDTTLSIALKNEKSTFVFKGGLEDGSKGTEYICLSRTAQCYNIAVSGGVWGNEVSWEIKPYGNEGAPSIASGGSPMDCQFGVAGGDCGDNCDGNANKKPENDPDYKEFKEAYKCLEDKCPIQVGICEKDAVCDKCFVEDAPDFCFAVDTFNAVVDCAMCKCIERDEDSLFCEHKMMPGRVIPPYIPDSKKQSGPKACSPQQTLKGADSVITFGECTDLTDFSIMITDFDQSHFGPLDTFETCSHAFAATANHGGHTALGCLRILVDAMNGVHDDDYSDENSALSHSIAALATSIYSDGESFCDCAKEASDLCPLCESFANFKTLLFESLDACQALDEIDCDAWNEFHKPCKKNLADEFGGKIDFSKEEQCKYVKNSCGDAGPFPVFRRLDCSRELSASAWDFYTDFAEGCLKDSGAKPRPTPDPTQTPAGPNSQPSNKKKYTPPEDRDKKKKKYTSADDDGDEGSDDDDDAEDDEADKKKKKSSHWFRNFILLCIFVGGGYYFYKRRSEGFNFTRNPRFRNFGGFRGLGGFADRFGMRGGGASGMDDGMYSGLAMESSYAGGSMEGSTSFEPPTLPPIPSAIDDNYA